jgi:IPT/TIG domain
MSTRLSFSRLVVVAVLSMVVAGFVYAGCVAPTITSVTPNFGPTGGGTSVTITGTNFGAPASATFGGVAATNVVVVNSTTMTATTPAHAAGPVDVIVQACAFSNSPPFPNGFTYQAAAAIPTFSPLTLAALAGILALVGALVIKR